MCKCEKRKKAATGSALEAVRASYDSSEEKKQKKTQAVGTTARVAIGGATEVVVGSAVRAVRARASPETMKQQQGARVMQNVDMTDDVDMTVDVLSLVAAPSAAVARRQPKLAYFPDPVKVVKKKGYPKPSLEQRLRVEGDQMPWSVMKPSDIKSGALEGHDVLVVPGGWAPNYCDQLGESGQRRIATAVKGGMGFVGICAGAYLGSTWGEWNGCSSRGGLINVDIVDIDHWNRGKTDDCRVAVEPCGRALLGDEALGDCCTGEAGMLTCRYNNGPILQCTGKDTIAAFTYVSDLRGKKSAIKTPMKGTPAVALGECGRGRVVLISPHMEGIVECGNVLRGLVR